jgi:Uma2 family endonuclease
MELVMGSAQRTQVPATYEDLCRVPEHQVAELIEGSVHAQPRPHSRHALAGGVLHDFLRSPFQRGRGGPGGWIILIEPELHLGNDVLVPDLAGWRRERLPAIPAEVGIPVVPDWICEVLSPGTQRLDRVLKMPLYARLGVGFLWLVDPLARTLDAFGLVAGHWQLLGSAVEEDPVQLPPFDAVPFDLGELWRW